MTAVLIHSLISVSQHSNQARTVCCHAYVNSALFTSAPSPLATTSVVRAAGDATARRYD